MQAPPGSGHGAFHTGQLTMSPFLFWIFASLTLVFGAAVVINRNPVASALSLVVSFLGLAALFMSLDAFFIGIIQVLVYAGAVMVLFLFIIMLLDIRAEEQRRMNWLALAGGLTIAVILLSQIFQQLQSAFADRGCAGPGSHGWRCFTEQTRTSIG